MAGLLYLGVVVIFCSFFMSASRLLNSFIVVENISFLVIVASSFLQSGVLFLSFIVIFTIESALALVVLFRLWDISALSDVVGV